MKEDKAPSFIKFGILTIITIVSWIFFNVYRILSAKPAPNVPDFVLSSFSPTLETEKITAIEERIFFEEGEVLTPTPTAEPTETPITTPEPTEEPEPSEEPTESPTPEPTETPI